MVMVKIVALERAAGIHLGADELALGVPFDVSTNICIWDRTKRGTVLQATKGSNARAGAGVQALALQLGRCQGARLGGRPGRSRPGCGWWLKGRR
jgi:hypothetical protein